MTAQRMLAVLQIGLLAGLAVIDAALLAEAFGLWTPGTLIPWPSLTESIPFGMLFLALLLTLNLPRWWFVGVSLAVAAATAGALAYVARHDYETPFYAAYFACTWLTLLVFRRGGLAWRHDAAGVALPPQIGLRSILLLTGAIACSLAVAGIIRRSLGPEDSDVSQRFGMRIAVPFNDVGGGVIWLQVLAFTGGAVLAVVSVATLLIVSRRGGPILRTVGGLLIASIACGLFLYTWRLENQWSYMLIESGFVAGFLGVNAAVIRAAGWTLEKDVIRAVASTKGAK